MIGTKNDMEAVRGLTQLPGAPTGTAKSVHNQCPYGNDDCPKCNPTSQPEPEIGRFYRRVSGKIYGTPDGGSSNIYYEDCTYEVKQLLHQERQKAEAAGRLDEVNHTPDNFFQIRDGEQVTIKERRAQLGGGDE